MKDVERELDELKALLTDIINESENDNLSLQRREELDEMYFDTENKIHSIETQLKNNEI